jgi:hypothetical protein
MSNICAGIEGQMEVLDSHIFKKKCTIFMLIYLKDIEGVVFSVPNDTFFSNYWLSAILIDPARRYRNY